MSYQKQNFVDGQVLKARDLNYVEDAMVEITEATIKNCTDISEITNNLNDTKKILEKSNIYAVTEGTDNNYTVTIEGLEEYIKGFGLCIEPHADSTGPSSLNINELGAIEIKDALGNQITTGGLKAGIPYNLRYNGVNFILLGKGGGGNATPDKLLEGYKVTVDTGQIVGTMRNNNNKISDWCHFENITVQPHPTDSSQGLVTIPMAVAPEINSGYYGSDSKIQANIASLNAGNIKAGVKVGRSDGSSANCITGTFTNDATAQAGHIISGQSAYVKGNKINGNMPNLAGQTVYGGAEGVKTVQIYPSNTGFLQVINTPSPNSKPYGYIDYTTKLENHIPLNILASALGITANKIVSGQQIAGVWGNVNQLKYATGEMVVQSNGYRQMSFTIPSTGFNIIAFSAWNATSLSSCGPAFGCNLGGNFTMTLDYSNSRNSSQSPSYKNYFTTSVVLHSPVTMTNYTIRWIAIGY